VKHEEKRSLGRPCGRQEFSIKMYLKEAEFEDEEWIHLAVDRDQWRTFVIMVSINCREFLKQLGHY
jgi:hypothetical protein